MTRTERTRVEVAIRATGKTPRGFALAVGRSPANFFAAITGRRRASRAEREILVRVLGLPEESLFDEGGFAVLEE